MESIKYFSKGYGKVNNPLENQPSLSSNQKTAQRRGIILAASFTVLLTLIVAALIGVLMHESATEPVEVEDEHPSSSSPFSSNPEVSLKTICAVTQHPDSCFTSISPLNNPPKADPVHLFNLSIQVNLQELTSLSSLPKTLISKSNDPRAEPALKDCLSLFDNSLSQLNNTAELMKVSPGEKIFTQMKTSNMQTWISAAMTDEETCLDGFEEMGSTVVDELKTSVRKSQEYMSNSLAILNNLQNLFGKFGLTVP